MDKENQIKIVFGIVVYKELFWETIAFKTLMQSIKAYGYEAKTLIYVIDNTDDAGWEVSIPSEYKGKIMYKNLLNPGISVAYNLIAHYASEEKIAWCVFLDQDTELPSNVSDVYMKVAADGDTKIKVPIVCIEQGILSPARYVNYRSKLFDSLQAGLLDLKNVSCINTGLMIETLFFKEIGGYNSNLKLDFCDHDFMERCKEKTDKIRVMGVKFHQDFSSITHTKQQAITRYKRYVNDFLVFREKRNKFVLFFYVDLPRLIKQTLKYKTLAFILIRLNPKK